jgi:hypothetical protein
LGGCRFFSTLNGADGLLVSTVSDGERLLSGERARGI